MTETASLERLLEKYKFTSPVSASMREMLPESRNRVLKSTLKELKTHSLWYALVLLILLKARNNGIKFSFTAAKFFAGTALIIASGMIISGTYAAVKYYKPYFDSVLFEKKNKSAEAVKEVTGNNGSLVKKESGNALVYDILLYSGKKYRGVIKSRGKSYVVSTTNGRVTIPAKQIKMIKRASD
ncbi:MAG: hypothetical protein JXN64_01625 [Spirochaetes bacterium]|nr:hypothetical protein [Spirochaetota bacterium]